MAQLVKTVQGVAIASVKTVQGTAIASVKTIQGVDNTGGGGALLTNLISYWKMDEASGTRADSHGSNDLTSTGVTSGTGVISNAGDFELDDAQDNLTISSNASLQTGNIDFTIQVWVKLEAKSGVSYELMGRWGAPGVREYTLFYVTGSDRFEFYVSSDGSSASSVVANNLGSPSAGTWYLIHAWHDATNDQIGIAVNAGTANTSAYSSGITAGTPNLTFGRNDDGNNAYLDGLIDEAAFWKRVLTSQERTDLYNGGSGLSYDNF